MESEQRLLPPSENSHIDDGDRNLKGAPLDLYEGRPGTTRSTPSEHPLSIPELSLDVPGEDAIALAEGRETPGRRGATESPSTYLPPTLNLNENSGYSTAGGNTSSSSAAFRSRVSSEGPFGSNSGGRQNSQQTFLLTAESAATATHGSLAVKGGANGKGVTRIRQDSYKVHERTLRSNTGSGGSGSGGPVTVNGGPSLASGGSYGSVMVPAPRRQASTTADEIAIDVVAAPSEPEDRTGEVVLELPIAVNDSHSPQQTRNDSKSKRAGSSSIRSDSPLATSPSTGAAAGAGGHSPSPQSPTAHPSSHPTASTSHSPIRGLSDIAGKLNNLLGPDPPKDPNLLPRQVEQKATIIDIRKSAPVFKGGNSSLSRAPSLLSSNPSGATSPRGGSKPRGISPPQDEDSASNLIVDRGCESPRMGAAPFLVDSRSLPNGPRGFKERGSAMANEAVTGMKNLLVSVNFMKNYISAEAKVMCMLVLIVSLANLGLFGAMIVEIYASPPQDHVLSPDSVCYQQSFQQILTNNFGYNIANLVTTAFFTSWFAFRAVRLEKEGQMLCFVAVALVHIIRSLYFCYDTLISSTSKLPKPLQLASQVIITAGDALYLFIFLLAVKVYRSFGWRMYTKGFTAVEQIRQLRRYKQLDAAIKLDTFITFNTFISIFFAVADAVPRYVAGVGTIVTMIFLFLAPWVIKKRYVWFIYLFALIGIVMPAFYSYIIIGLTLEKDSCGVDLNRCIGERHISVYNSSAWAIRDANPSYYCAPAAEPGLAQQCIGAPNCSFAALGTVELSVAQSCFNPYNISFLFCCDKYGQCGLKANLREKDRILMLILAVVAVVCRIVTIALGFRQARDMNLPSLRELLQRSDANKALAAATAKEGEVVLVFDADGREMSSRK
jgi:hypothetical protein